MNKSNRIGAESEEKSVRIYGKKVRASGAGPFEKLDIFGMGPWLGWRGENKATENKSYTINTEMLLKGMRQAAVMQAKPFYVLDFQLINRRFVLVEEERWIQLFSLLNERENA